MNVPSIPNYKNIVPLDSGSSSTLFRADHILTGQSVALKVFDMSNLSNHSKSYVQREISIHKSLEHPFICSYYTSFIHFNELIISIESLSGKTLLQKVNESRGLFEFEAQRIFSQIVSAVLYLHQDCKIAHRDLKLENMLIEDYSGNIKLFDFGISSSFDNQDNKMKTQCGSLPYCAPEIIINNSYTGKVDVWSLGVVLFTMLTGEFPFDDANLIGSTSKILNEEPAYPVHLSENALDLLKRMFIKNPKYRISIEEIAEHPWLENSKYNVIELNKQIKEHNLSRFGKICQSNGQNHQKSFHMRNNTLDLKEITDYTKLKQNENLDVDTDVLNDCSSLNININLLINQLISNEDSDLTSTYRIFRNLKCRQNFLILYNHLILKSSFEDNNFIAQRNLEAIPYSSTKPESRRKISGNSMLIQVIKLTPLHSAVISTASGKTGCPSMMRMSIAAAGQNGNYAMQNSNERLPHQSLMHHQGKKIPPRLSKPSIKPCPIVPGLLQQ
ncbi:CAMK family protein kinase [Tritrichomonas foetus]|uniref:CAMK family protein kinase n=1 Tax=Tritrichomonas foetus TaxID=1144522 RepID=A0A1J4L368_9EUKA|nr:CAMK family protein kinase [Tritrichomonas foetus]|eukprot:OHT16420.1 CAMK family protein kinase [Tritrichomonas foetus]